MESSTGKISIWGIVSEGGGGECRVAVVVVAGLVDFSQ